MLGFGRGCGVSDCPGMRRIVIDPVGEYVRATRLVCPGGRVARRMLLGRYSFNVFRNGACRRLGSERRCRT